MSWKTIIAVAALTLWLPANAEAVPVCTDRESMVSILADRFGEEIISIGLSNDGFLIEVMVSKGGETFTITATNKSGISCILTHGEGWRTLNKSQQGDAGA